MSVGTWFLRFGWSDSAIIYNTKKGDVITIYNGNKVESPDDTMKFYKALKNNPKVQIEVKRDGKPLTINSGVGKK